MQNDVVSTNIQEIELAAGETDWWYDARGVENVSCLKEIEKSNCTHIVVDIEQVDKLKTKKQRVVWIAKKESLAKISPDDWVFTPDEKIRQQAAEKKHKAGLLLNVENLQEEFPKCVAVCERGDIFVVIDIKHATYIPYELLIAKAERTGTKVLRCVPIKELNEIVSDVDQSLNAFATMEQGISVLFKTQDISNIRSLSKILQGRQRTKLPLFEAEVVSVQHTGLGNRVCVDSTSMMSAEEGMIIGSTGWGGLLVCSETHFLPHMNLREFRVNAGAVHSYIWGANGDAMYLSEMTAGSEVISAHNNGTARIVTVGRAKIERRPLLSITCKVDIKLLPKRIADAAVKDAKIKRRVTPVGEEIAGSSETHVYINTFLQNDWHVRVMGADGKVRHCSLLKAGDKLLAHIDYPGRHTGLRVTEHILEK